METAHPALDEIDGDEYGEEDCAGEDGEWDGHTRRWVRYVMPVMVEVDCDTDEIASVVTLPSEIRLDRDDAMRLCITTRPSAASPPTSSRRCTPCSSTDLSGSTPPSAGAACQLARHHRLA
jgi:hypothetical protein